MTVTEPEQHTRPAGAPVYPDFEFDAAGSPSRYRHYQSGRGVNYYTADPDLQASLNTYLDPTTRGWAEDVLTDLGERAGTELARRADVYDAAGHELVRYDRFGRDISRVDHHPDWLSSLNEVFDFGLVGWNSDRTGERNWHIALPLFIGAVAFAWWHQRGRCLWRWWR